MGINVAVLASEPEICRIRVAPLLDALTRAGAIADYVLLDRDLAPIGRRGFDAFNAVIVQRNVSRAQLRFLARQRLRFVYDIDDLLPRLPAHQHRKKQETSRRIAWCLAHADAVSTPNQKLAIELEEATGVSLQGRGIVVPNGLEPVAVDESGWAVPARQLLWVSSDLPMIETEAPGLAEAIATAANELGLKAILIGRFPDRIKSLFDRIDYIPRLGFADYRRFLASLRRTIAVAPLPFHSESHQAFIDSKSDIKAVDFLGHGIPAVYSAAWPYRNSDLDLAPLVANEPHRWREAIADVAGHPAGHIDGPKVQAVHRQRSYATVATMLGDQLARSAMPYRPLPRPSINSVLRGWEQRIRQWRRSRRKSASR
ncbi:MULTISPECIES: hypothetical protein [unclassified Mesorhizobium]|uniref:hypothetical protein n=1 Tax=unclassified Mesorhizobium TaxID=325217 RepID=UPI000BAF7B18|nr:MULTISPECIES: hypothetical protein [unclassified Mesorhizobium]TGT60979.1 hypothetical protein EN813_018570 [Mesorhizobium sp. M00.F.Ca.ET.170.01.1.1]AZO08746.1 hypothetical protein EJ074_06190 [Mesorhizobium sp. M3A.F.Ca.ET.080.04.2.1]PBB84105.1 hypothetical protein CK216_25365 [Mesorhizobium sp. WSM3876]RWB72129.1 MAG: hypothetical protein EOQ49_12865 [Mesorhizobium sp.]RWB83666.1 MAG: hypothetical protein EOQ52_26015 [Mesorhizobium sp.]